MQLSIGMVCQMLKEKEKQKEVKAMTIQPIKTGDITLRSCLSVDWETGLALVYWFSFWMSSMSILEDMHSW